MKNLKKRILSSALAGVLAVSMAIPAFAEDPSTVLTATYAQPVISVTVPATGAVVINPYGMPVVLNPDAASTDQASIVGAQIVTKPLAIVNNGATDLKVSATVTAETTGDLRLATSKPSSSDTTKSAYVYLQMTNSALDEGKKATSSGAATAIAGMDNTEVSKAVAAWEQRAYASSTDLLLSGTAAATKENMLTLKAKDAATGLQVGSVGLFRLAGQVVASPRDAWATTDGFTATVAFSFKPDLTTASVDNATLSLSMAGTKTGDLIVSLDNNTTITDVAWESSDESKATVAALDNPADHSKATVTGVATGTATITATITASNGLTYEVTCDVTIGA